MAPAFLSRFNFLKIPIDNGIKFRNKPLLGKNKTYRGLIGGIVFSIIVALIQSYLYKQGYFHSISLIDYTSINPFLLGFLMGFGAMFGDLVESVFKRQINIKPGKPLYFLDQTDWIIGSTLFLMLVYVPDLLIVLASLLLGFIFHIIVKNMGYYLKLEKSRW